MVVDGFSSSTRAIEVLGYLVDGSSRRLIRRYSNISPAHRSPVSSLDRFLLGSYPFLSSCCQLRREIRETAES